MMFGNDIRTVLLHRGHNPTDGDIEGLVHDALRLIERSSVPAAEKEENKILALCSVISRWEIAARARKRLWDSETMIYQMGTVHA